MYSQTNIQCSFSKKYLLSLGVLLFTFSLFAQLDVKNGPIKIYYPNGQISSEGYVKDGNPDGYWITYYPTGIVKSEGKRTNFQLDSTWNFYNQLGELTEVINYQLGKKSGFTLKYTYDNPKQPAQKTLISKELFINDRREGTSQFFYHTGELKQEVIFSKGKKEGYSKLYDTDSVIISLEQYKDNYLISREGINRKDTTGLKQGKHKEFFDNGKVKSEVNFLDNELHGYFREYDEEGLLVQTLRYENGVIMEEIDEEAKEIIDFKRTYDEKGRLVFSGGYKEGIAIGIHRFFDSTGIVVNSYIYNQNGDKISEGIIDLQGKRRGKWIDYYVSSEVKAKGYYKNNKRSGSWIFYFRNGKIEQRGNYLNGRLDSEWIWYYPSGEVWRQETYFNGREDGYSVEYDKLGEIITEGNYISGEKDGEWFYKVGDHTEIGKYIYGLREGKWIYYYLDENIQFEGKYLQGFPDGKQVFYYENGKIKEEQYYRTGVREKSWRKYDEFGNNTLTITYKNNSEVRINGIKTKLPESDVKFIR